MLKEYKGQFRVCHPNGVLAFGWQGVSGNAKQRRLIVRRWKKQRGFTVTKCVAHDGR